MRAALKALLGLAALACGGPQSRTQVSAVYSAGFNAEAGVNTEVIFPLPDGALAQQLVDAITVSNGGTASLSTTDAGVGLSVKGKGAVTASAQGQFGGFPDSAAVPDVKLSRAATEPNAYLFSVNKGGSALVQVDFSFTAARDCGSGCGGARAWNYAGPVGLGPQPITVNFKETPK